MKKLSILILLLLLVGCGNKAKESKVIVGIIRVPNDTVVAIEKGWIESSFKELGLDVEFKFFDSGVSMNQAFASGSLDIAEMGFTNGVVALSKNLPVSLFWIHDVIGETEALVAYDDSIQSIQDLKGKKIATVFSSTSHLSLLKTLQKVNLTPKDVTLLNMETAEIVAAWKRGDLDAAYSWEPTLSEIKQTGRVLLTSKDLANEGIMTTNVGLVSNEFAKKYPEALKAFISALSKAKDLLDSDFDEVVRLTAHYLDISEDLTRAQIQGSMWLSMEELVSSEYLGESGQFLKIFKDTATFWYENGFINNELTDEEIREFINPGYIIEVLKQDD